MIPGQPFPTLRSLLDPAALLDTIAREYALDAPHSCTLLRTSWNDTYLVRDAAQKYILRVCAAPPHTAEDARPYPFNGGGQPRAALDYELALLERLAREGVGIARPIRRRDGEPITPLPAAEGTRYAVLFEHAPGIVAAPHPFSSTDQSRRVGAALARLHEVAVTFAGPNGRPPRTLGFYLDQPLTTILPSLQDRPADRERLLSLAEMVRHRLAAESGQAPSMGVVHGDPYNANASVTESGELAWFDFDLAGPGWPAMDLTGAYGCTQLPSVPVGERVPRWQAFLAGYQSHRMLPDNDLAAIPALLVALRIFGCAIHLTRLQTIGSGAIGTDYFDRHLALLEETAAEIE